MAFKYRTVFLSDTHLGFAGVHAAELSAFLKHLKCERLYLVGDILDLWALRSKWRWPAMHNQVVRRVLKLAKKGTAVTYVPGNHDDSLRQYFGLDLGGVKLAKQAVHRTADGKHLLVTHGDEYDLVVQHSRWLSVLGTWAYDHLINLNRAVNAVRGVFGLKRWSFSGAIKAKVKSACTFVSKFEEVLLDEARRRGLDGVVCGHIHQPALRVMGGDAGAGGSGSDAGTGGGGGAGGARGGAVGGGAGGGGVIYANCGDWIERATCLVEHHDGRLEVVDVVKLLAERGVEVKQLAADEVALEGDDEEIELPLPAAVVPGRGVDAADAPRGRAGGLSAGALGSAAGVVAGGAA